MRYLVNGKEMKEIDRRSIEEYGIPSLVLMERAALEIANEVESFHASTVCSVCGLGNNGADGVAAARILFLRGISVTVILPTFQGQMSEEMKVQLKIAKKLGIPVYSLGEFIPSACDIVIDAIFGIGLTRTVEGRYAELIQLIMEQKKEYGAKIISVDIPSGISSDTGKVMGCAVEADITVTFGEQKLGQSLYPGRVFCGKLKIADIGFVPEKEETSVHHICAHTKNDLSWIPKRKRYSHKGDYGRILVAAGSRNMAGAAYFTAKAAYRTGAGLVKIMTPEENRLILQEKLPEAILSAYDTKNGKENPEGFHAYIKKEIEWADVIVLGPGLGTEEVGRQIVEEILSHAYVPIILDADAINFVSKYPYLKQFFTENIIMTPHLAECGRFTGKSIDEIRENLLQTARDISEQYGVTCILKDAATITSRKDGKVFVNTSGSPAMAKGGSGDVLCGVIAGLLGLGMEECDAASIGVYVHGLAGEAAERKYGVHSVLAGELADCIGEVINETI